MDDKAGVAHYRATHMWADGHWQAQRALAVGADGRIQAAAADDGERLGEWVLPGMPNLHSHAFQRAMAGLAERKGVALGVAAQVAGQRGEDSFWSWRETMYRFAAAIDPASLKAIAAQLYVEMLKAGYTQVCEFHYLHHQPLGTPYAPPEAMSLALIEAAAEAGIALTLLPVLYMTGGFDGRALGLRQQRFGHTVDGYLKLVGSLRRHESPDVRIGIALHSLRAVPELALREVLACELAHDCPLHVHVAEQLGEVQDCMALRGARPVQWLLDHANVDPHWCLVHATHMTDTETVALAQRGAVAGLCPTTEGNLGDGLFPLAAYIDAGGTFGIGSDSHISVSPVEELRWLEYGQRLKTHHRNIAARAHGASVGETLWRAALRGGAQASGLPIGALHAGARADLIVLDEAAPLLAGHAEPSLLDSFLFAGNAPLVRDVMVGGRWQVRGFHHRDEERIAARYRQVVTRLMAADD